MFGVSDFFINQCVERFDESEQLDILEEECAELIQACSKLKRSLGHYTMTDPLDNLKMELTHVAISSAVVSKLYGIKQEDIDAEVNKKAAKYNFKKEVNIEE